MPLPPPSSSTSSPAGDLLLGLHWIARAEGCDPSLLADARLLADTLRALPDRLGLTRIAEPVVGEQQGGGVAGVVLLSESHASLHAVPAAGVLFADVFSCAPFAPEAAAALLVAAFTPAVLDQRLEARGGAGLTGGTGSIRHSVSGGVPGGLWPPRAGRCGAEPRPKTSNPTLAPWRHFAGLFRVPSADGGPVDGAAIFAALGFPEGTDTTWHFEPHGVSWARVAPHGRAALHSWPEHGLVTIDVYAPVAVDLSALVAPFGWTPA